MVFIPSSPLAPILKDSGGYSKLTVVMVKVIITTIIRALLQSQCTHQATGTRNS